MTTVIAVFRSRRRTRGCPSSESVDIGRLPEKVRLHRLTTCDPPVLIDPQRRNFVTDGNPAKSALSRDKERLAPYLSHGGVAIHDGHRHQSRIGRRPSSGIDQVMHRAPISHPAAEANGGRGDGTVREAEYGDWLGRAKWIFNRDGPALTVKTVTAGVAIASSLNKRGATGQSQLGGGPAHGKTFTYPAEIDRYTTDSHRTSLAADSWLPTDSYSSRGVFRSSCGRADRNGSRLEGKRGGVSNSFETSEHSRIEQATRYSVGFRRFCHGIDTLKRYFAPMPARPIGLHERACAIKARARHLHATKDILSRVKSRSCVRLRVNNPHVDVGCHCAKLSLQVEVTNGLVGSRHLVAHSNLRGFHGFTAPDAPVLPCAGGGGGLGVARGDWFEDLFAVRDECELERHVEGDFAPPPSDVGDDADRAATRIAWAWVLSAASCTLNAATLTCSRLKANSNDAIAGSTFAATGLRGGGAATGIGLCCAAHEVVAANTAAAVGAISVATDQRRCPQRELVMLLRIALVIRMSVAKIVSGLVLLIIVGAADFIHVIGVRAGFGIV